MQLVRPTDRAIADEVRLRLAGRVDYVPQWGEWIAGEPENPRGRWFLGEEAGELVAEEVRGILGELGVSLTAPPDSVFLAARAARAERPKYLRAFMRLVTSQFSRADPLDVPGLRSLPAPAPVDAAKPAGFVEWVRNHVTTESEVLFDFIRRAIDNAAGGNRIAWGPGRFDLLQLVLSDVLGEYVGRLTPDRWGEWPRRITYRDDMLLHGRRLVFLLPLEKWELFPQEGLKQLTHGVAEFTGVDGHSYRSRIPRFYLLGQNKLKLGLTSHKPEELDPILLQLLQQFDHPGIAGGGSRPEDFRFLETEREAIRGLFVRGGA